MPKAKGQTKPSTPSRRRKTRLNLVRKRKQKSIADDKLYKVRTILDEKVEKGKLWYNIDWADDSETGESYPPNWEPCENVTEAAIADWEEEKRRHTLPIDSSLPQSSCDPDSQPVLPPGWRTTALKHRRNTSSSSAQSGRDSPKKRKIDRASPSLDAADCDSNDEDTTWKFASQLPQERGALIVGVPADPQFDPAAYISVRLSQAPTTDYPREENPAPTGGISQSTIPDSQEFTDSLPSRTADGAAWGSLGLGKEAPDSLPSHSSSLPLPGSLVSSNTSAPPELFVTPPELIVATPGPTRTAEQRLSTRWGEAGTNRGQSEPRGRPAPSQHPSQVRRGSEPSSWSTYGAGQAVPRESFDAPGSVLPAESTLSANFQNLSSSVSPYGRFRSQVDFGLEIPVASSSRPSGCIRSQNSVSGIDSSGPPNPQSQDSPSIIPETSPYSAQVVQPSASVLGDIRTQSSQDNTESSIGLTGYLNPQPSQTPLSPTSDPREKDNQAPTTSSDQESEPQDQSRTKRASPLLESIEEISEAGEDHPTAKRRYPTCRPPPSSPTSLPLTASRGDEPTYPSPRTPQSASMDISDSSTPLSAVERFRRLQAEVYGEAADQTPSHPSRSLESAGGQPSGATLSPAVPSQDAATSSNPASLPSEARAASPAPHPDPSSIAPPGGSPDNRAVLHSQEEDREGSHSLQNPSEAAPVATAAAAAASDTTTSGRPSSTDDDILAEPDTALPGPELGPDRYHATLSGTDAEIDSQHYSADMDYESPASAMLRPIGGAANDYTVTLPMAASTRQSYLDAIRSNKSTMMAFGEPFHSDSAGTPDPTLTAKLDSIFQRLFDYCDLPAFAESLPEMAPGDMMKHATGTNCKFSFLFEFLSLIRDLPSRVLVIAAPGRVFDYIQAVLSVSRFRYEHLGHDPVAGGHGDLTVVLAASDQDLAETQRDFDVVVLFDGSARGLDLPPAAAPDSKNDPIILSLVVTCSIEHIDLRLSENGDALERKNAMNFALVASQGYLRDLRDSMPGTAPFMEPHEVAQHFASLLRDPDSVPDWEPQSIPDECFDFYLSSQPTPGGPSVEATTDSRPTSEPVKPNGRKHHIDETEEGSTKRIRVSETRRLTSNKTPPAMSDLLKKTLASYSTGSKPSGPTIEITVEVLESMAAKLASQSDQLRGKDVIESRLSRQIKDLEAQLSDYQHTVKKIQPRYMEALRDRGDFQEQCSVALRDLSQVTGRLEESQAKIDSLKAQNNDLETKLRASSLLEGSNPSVAQVGASTKDLQEAKARIEVLEKKLAATQKDMDYSRDAYQRASSSASELGVENSELREKLKKMELRASDNLARIHQINAQNETREYQRLWEEGKAALSERELELERVREELRVLQSGRRDTRHPSVPRSPRTRVMRGGIGGGGGAPGGAGSRGTSPAAPYGSSDAATTTSTGPGMTFFSQVPGSARWGHLRE